MVLWVVVFIVDNYYNCVNVVIFFNVEIVNKVIVGDYFVKILYIFKWLLLLFGCCYKCWCVKMLCICEDSILVNYYKKSCVWNVDIFFFNWNRLSFIFDFCGVGSKVVKWDIRLFIGFIV